MRTQVEVTQEMMSQFLGRQVAIADHNGLTRILLAGLWVQENKILLHPEWTCKWIRTNGIHGDYFEIEPVEDFLFAGNVADGIDNSSNKESYFDFTFHFPANMTHVTVLKKASDRNLDIDGIRAAASAKLALTE